MQGLSGSKRKQLHSSYTGESLKARLVRGALGVGGLKLIQLPLTLLISILLARGLEPAGYGQYSFVMAAIAILALPVASGLGQLVTREVAKYHHGEDWGLFRGLLQRAHQWIFLGSAILVVAVVLVAGRNASWAVDDQWTLLLIATPLLPLLGLNALRSATLRGLRNVFYAQLPELVARPWVNLLVIAGLAYAGLLNPATALFSQILAAGFAFGLGAWLLMRLKPPNLCPTQAEYQTREWWRALLPFTLLSAVSTLNGQIGILALGWLGTNEDIAALRVAMSGAVLVMLSLSIVNMVIGPHIARAHRDGDAAHLQKLSRQSARAALAVGLPMALALIFFGGQVVELLFGEEYRNLAALPLAILAFGQLMNLGFGSVGTLLSMTGYERDTLSGQALALSFNAIAAVILIPPFGVVGAALSVAIGIASWNVVLTVRCVQRLGFRPSAF